MPYPPNYGGVIDVFYKIKALHEAGAKIHLHCFDYGRGKSDKLLKYCHSVNYYPRTLTFYKQFSRIPFIVITRNSKELICNLQKDNYPIIMEGLHCTYPLYSNNLNSRKIIVRSHNIEHEYYDGLAKSEKNPLKKWYFNLEATKLKQYEIVLKNATAIAAISKGDYTHFSKINPHTELVYPFHPFTEVTSKPGKGTYILIHGDMSVAENIQSTLWLINNVVSKCSFPFIIAGKNPASEIFAAVQSHHNITIVPNPDDIILGGLVENAHIHLIHSFFPQGFKLKLLHVLFKGRHCICNFDVVKDTGLESLCRIANDSTEFLETINELMDTSFDIQLTQTRTEKLRPFSNSIQAQKLLKAIF
ncbi:MAG: glycosyltransferase family 1 protein [Bacteroidales bacterium]